MPDTGLIGDKFPQPSILIKVAKQGFEANGVPNIPQGETDPRLLFSEQVDIARSATMACPTERFPVLGTVAVNRVVGVDPWHNVPPANPGNIG